MTATPVPAYAPAPEATFGDEVSRGLAQTPKTLPCKYLYDERGSALFDQICELEEYYPTRTELGIMRDRVSEIARTVGPDTLLVEYGSGSSTKTRLLLDALPDLMGYVPIDISRKHLLATGERLRANYQELEVMPLVADFTRPLRLPSPVRKPRRTVIYFPGSTIGNFTIPEARGFLSRAAELAGAHGGLLIGVDLEKDPSILEPAYDDRKGVTAAFNLNLLARINRELGGTFDLSGFRHRAAWDGARRRMELSLVSVRAQVAMVNGQRVAFREGESIVTEYSHKYTLERFRHLARSAGWRVDRVWTDRDDLFSVHYLRVGQD